MKGYLKASAFVLLTSFLLGASGCSFFSPDIDFTYDDDGFGGSVVGIETGGTSGDESETGSDTGDDAVPTEVVLVDNSFRFDRDNMPLIDGSAAMLRFAVAMESVLMGTTEHEAAEELFFHRTAGAYEALLAEDAQIILVPSPSTDIQQQIADSGESFEFVPFAREALVFYVSEDNPVDSLTTEQIRGIYSGEITNWSEVGGEDMEIVPFSRLEGTGAQTAFDTFITNSADPADDEAGDQIDETSGGDTAVGDEDGLDEDIADGEAALPDAAEDAEDDEDASVAETSGNADGSDNDEAAEDASSSGSDDADEADENGETAATDTSDASAVSDEDDEENGTGDETVADDEDDAEYDDDMTGESEDISEELNYGYDNAPGSIGYSLYHYLNEENQLSEGYKLIEVNDVTPSFESISNGTYPYVDFYFAVIRADEEEMSPVRILRNWLVSSDGQSLVLWEGFVPMTDVREGRNG